MEKLKDILKLERLERKETLSTLSIKSGIAVAVLNKIENGVRVPNRLQLEAISKALKIKGNHLKTVWLAEKILYEIGEDEDGLGALKLAESFYNYKIKKNDQIEILLLEIDKLKKKLDKKRPLPQAQLRNLMGAFKIDYTYESNKIEGNTLNLQETAMVVDKGITMGGKSLNEHLEAINHSEAFEFILELVKGKTEISEYNLLQIHAIILKSIDKENAGRYRKINVRIGGSKHTPTEPYLIRPQMEDLFNYYERMKLELHPLLLAADMHYKLVTIHPFINGNGRTSRLLMNLIAYQFGYPMINISGNYESRMGYYKALEITREPNHQEAFREFILKEAIKSLKDWIKWVG